MEKRQLRLPDPVPDSQTSPGIANGPALDDGRLMFAFAHDIRGYLRTVLTRIQLVQRGAGEALPEEDRFLLEEAATAAGELGELLNSMVSYCNVEAASGEMPLKLLVQGTLMERKASLAAAGAQVDVSNDFDKPVPASLQKVLKELLTNSCKFRHPDRPLRIAITAREVAEDTLHVTVSDNGLGVDPAYLDKICLPFQRFHSRDEFPGHGLGLAICRRLASKWGGSVTAAPARETGLAVVVTIPLSGG